MLDGAGVEEALRVEPAVEDLIGGWGVWGRAAVPSSLPWKRSCGRGRGSNLSSGREALCGLEICGLRGRHGW